jgi:ADP-heptose:LPS heptosyltransferase
MVVSVDTSVAHLAGALGTPTLLLLPYSPDYRWMVDRTDTPWYPLMRLLRQAKIGQWDQPLRALSAAVHLNASQHRAE